MCATSSTQCSQSLRIVVIYQGRNGKTKQFLGDSKRASLITINDTDRVNGLRLTVFLFAQAKTIHTLSFLNDHITICN